MALLEVCKASAQKLPASRDEPQQGQECAEMGWGESQKKQIWPSLVLAGIPRPHATRKVDGFFIKAHELWVL